MLISPLSLAEIAAIAVFLFVHDAPSGWRYPKDCCASKDCRQIACSTIKDNPDGTAVWTGLLFHPEQVKISGDAACHVCLSYGQPPRVRFPHCIFLSPTM
jgi:hypothetical protein